MANLISIQPLITTLVVVIILLGISVLFIMLIKKNQAKLQTDKYLLISDMPRLNEVLRLIDYRIKSSKLPIFFTLLLISIDDFDSIKDIMNEDGANEYLYKVVTALRAILPVGAKIAQTEEKESFLIYLPEYFDDEILPDVAQKFKTIAQQSFVIRDNIPIQKTVSVAVTTYPAQGEDVVALINNLLISIYTAKKAGGNGLVYYSKELEKERSYTERYKEIKQAIDKGRLLIKFCPIINVESDEIDGAQIVSCQVDNNGNIAIGNNLNDYLQEYDDDIWYTIWSLEKAILLNKQIFHNGQGREFILTIYTGFKFLTDANSAEKLQNSLARYNIDANNVILEVDDILDNELGNRFVKNLMQMQGIGVRISAVVDSSRKDLLKLIETYDVDLLKVDVQDMIDTKQKGLQELLKLAYNHRKKVIVSGIENKEQLEKIKNKTVAYVQGDYFGSCLSESQLQKSIGID